MDQLICASLSYTHYWYEVGMLKVPALSTSADALYIYCCVNTINSTSSTIHDDFGRIGTKFRVFSRPADFTNPTMPSLPYQHDRS